MEKSDNFIGCDGSGCPLKDTCFLHTSWEEGDQMFDYAPYDPVYEECEYYEKAREVDYEE